MQLFAGAANILWKIGVDPQIVQEFRQLASKAKAAASEAMDAEAILGDIPDEFLDPIQVLLYVQNIIVFFCRIKYKVKRSRTSSNDYYTKNKSHNCPLILRLKTETTTYDMYNMWFS